MTAATLKKVFGNLSSQLRKQFDVVALQYELGFDVDGDDAVFVTVVLKDKADDYRWGEVASLDSAVKKTMRSKVPDREPYVKFAQESEVA